MVKRSNLSDHEWKMVWKEALDEGARRRVRRATWRGGPLADPFEAAAAVERARRGRAAAKAAVAMNMLTGVLFLAVALALTDLPASGHFWWFVTVWTAMVLIAPLVGLWRVRRLDAAIQANRERAEGGGTGGPV